MVFRRRKISDRVQTFVDEIVHMLQRESANGMSHAPVRVIQAARLESRILMSASPIAMVAEAAADVLDSSVAVLESAEVDDFAESFSSSQGTEDLSQEQQEQQQEPENDATWTEDPATAPLEIPPAFVVAERAEYYAIVGAAAAAEVPVAQFSVQAWSDTATFDQVTANETAVNETASTETAGNNRATLREQADDNEDVSTGTHLIVIDYRVQDADDILSHLLNDDRDVRLLRLSSDEDGLQQITKKLEQLGNVSAIHLLTHGRDGEILLGNTQLNSGTLAQHAPELLAWQHALTANADLLLYGCDVAGTTEGQDFVESLSRLTGAEIAASTDSTGSSSLGGDWILEYTTGHIDQPGVFAATIMDSWQHQLVAGVTITVTTTNDVVDGTTTSVAALLASRGADGQISLREALLAANANADVDEIVLGAGEYRIQITGHEETGARGDFDVTQSLTIRGAGSSVSIINGNSIDRVFHVRGTANLTISGVTITGGDTRSDGGGIAVTANASLTVNQSAIAGNSTEKKGGGIFNEGTVTLTDVTLSQNTARSEGGGLSTSGDAALMNVTVSSNTATRGAGIFHDGRTATGLSLVNVTVSGNTATNSGGGLYLGEDASLQNVTIAFNEATSAGAGLQVSNASVTLKNTLLASNLLTTNASANVAGVVLSLGNNLSSDGTASLNQSGDRSNVDPLLQTLSDNGGFTQTHALAQNSVALDAGASSGAPTNDQRGTARDGAVDIGAYEFDRAFLATSQFQVNSTVDGDQVTSAENRGNQQSIARDHAGNYIITWSSQSQDGSGWGVYARRFDFLGRPLSGEFRVNQQTADNQQWASIAADAAGNFVVTWTSTNQDGAGQSIYARRYSAAGAPLSNEFLVNSTTTGIQKNAVISMSADGRFVIAWQGEGPGNSAGIFFRRYAADGSALDTTDRLVNNSTADAHINPALAMDRSGNFVVVWQESSKVYFQRFSSAGVAQGSRVQVDNGLSTSAGPAVAMDAAGNFTIVYREQTILPGIWGRGFNSNGTERYSWFRAASGDDSSPSISMADDGQFVLAWQSSGDGEGTGIYARKFFASGAANGAEFLVNQYTAGNQSQASLTMLDPNNFVVVWSGQTSLDGTGVSARQFGTAVSRVLRAQDDFITTETNASVTVDVLGNDTRPTGGTAIRLDVSHPLHGTAAVTADGMISYTPATAYAGDDTLTYLISDGTDGTTNYWSLGGTGVDSVGGRHGTLQGTTTIAGSFGSALQFDEVNDYVEIPDTNYNSSFTVSFDFRIDENSGSQLQYLYGHGNVDVVNSLNIFFGESSHSTAANILKTSFGDSNDTYNIDALNTNIASLIGDGQWHTYTLTVDKATGSRVYIDGALRATAATRGGDAFNPTGNLFLGARSDLNTARFFGGGLDSVRIFNRALSATDVSSLNTGASPSATSAQSTGTISVTVQNAAPSAVINGPYATSVAIPASFTAAGTSDLNGDTLTYEWDFRYDGVTFSADATGSNTTASWAQLEAAGVQVGSNTVALRVIDSRGAETLVTTTLQVSPNAAPTGITLSNMIVPGGQSGATVGTLATADATVGDSHNYSVSDNRFEIVAGQLKLRAGQSVNRDTETAISLSVTTTDLASNQLTRTFVLTVGNGPVVARDNPIATNENTTLTMPAPGVLANDDRPNGSATTGALLEFNAAQDTNSDALWQNTTNRAGFDLTLGAGVTRNAAPSSNHHGILSAFDFNGSTTSRARASQSLAALPGNPTDGSATFELWFRPDELNRQYILFDSGSAQTGTGLSLRLNGTTLEYSVYTGSVGETVSSNISTALATGDFVQFVGTVRVSGGVATLEMFVNGVSVGSETESGFSTWSDTLENFALGNIDGTVSVSGNTGADAFAGEMALFRVYDTVLTNSQVQQNFNAVAGQQAGLTVTSTDTTTDGTRGVVSVGANGSVTYNPNGQFESLAAGSTATDSFRYTVSDGSGNTDTAQVTVTVTGVNDAPVLTPAARALGSIVANATSPSTTVSTLLGSSVTDVDSGALRGIAVTGTSGAGAWQYSVNGTTWNNFGTVSSTQALLLRSTDQIRFAGNGTVAGTASISFAAWDRTTGTAESKSNLTVTGRGGSTAFSTATDTATMTLTRVNIVPVGTSDSYSLDEDTSLTTTTASGWFDSHWSTRQRITFNNSTGAVVTNQPVLITLDSSRIDYSRTLNNGHDLRFVDGNGALLNYEIETWDEAGTSRVWVMVPQIDASSSTDFVWMYYGNSMAANVQNPAAVWNSQEAVLHMNGALTDSSPNGIGVTESSTTASSGISAGARTFNGVNSFVRLGASAEVDNLFQNGGTVSAWINPTGWGGNGYGRIADKASTTFGGVNGSGWALQVTSTGRILFEHGFGTSHGEWQTPTGQITLNTWRQVTVVYNASSTSNTPRIFINGAEVSVTRTGTPSGSFVSDAAQQLTVGNHAAATSRSFAGRIDEFRASKTSLTSAQVLADFRSTSGALTTIGAAEAGPGGVLTNDSDPDNDPLSVTLLSGPNHSQAFSLNSNGTFTYTPTANYTGTDSFTYALSDGLSTVSPITVTLNIRPVSDAPSGILLSNSSFAGYTDGAVVGSITVNDPDAGDSHTVSVSDTRFEVAAGQLKLRAGQVISPIAEPSVTMLLTATDSMGLTRTDSFTLTTIDINTSPALSITPVVTSIDENTTLTASVLVASIAVSDDGIGTNVLSLSGADAASFELIGQDLYLRAGAILDFESRSRLNVVVEVDDANYGGNPDDAKTFLFSVGDINEAPTLALNPILGSIAENTDTTASIRVANLVITDDALGTNTLTLLGPDAGLFEVIGDGLFLRAGTVLDFESRLSFSVTVEMDDVNVGLTPDGSSSHTLTITNVNEAPVGDMNGPYTIAEGDSLTVDAAGSIDPDGDSLTYEWDLDGDYVFNDASGINPTLTWAALRSSAAPVDDDGARNIRLRVTDSAGLSTIVTTTLTITNTAPVISVTGNADVDSGTNYVLQLLSADSGDDTISSWTINWGDGITQTISGSLSSATHQYLTPGGTRSITVTATDEDGTYAMASGPWVVVVNNRPPENLTISELRVVEGISGAVVGGFDFTDVDFGDQHIVTVSDSRFEVSEGQLRLRAGQALNHSIEATVSLDITVTDLSGAATTQNFTLTVDRLPIPRADQYAVDGTRQLNISSGLAGVLSNDVDPDNNALQALLHTGPTNAAAFGLNSDGTFWYRAVAGFSGTDSFTYLASDGEGSSGPVTVTLIVNQPATIAFVRSTTSIAENTVLNARQLIGQFIVSDDGIGTNTVTLSGGDVSVFELDGANNLYLRAGVTLDHELRQTLSVRGNVDDAAIGIGPDNSRVVALVVSDVNERPVTTGLSTVVSAEDAGTQTIATSSAFSDVDGDVLQYSLQLLSSTSGLLDTVSINSSTGQISYRTAPNAFGTAQLLVIATDSSGLSAQSQFTLQVQNVNDAPVVREFASSTFTGQPLVVTTPGLMQGATDAESQAIEIVLIQGPRNGTLTLNPDGRFIYRPNVGFFGYDSFLFAGSDGLATGMSMTATIDVQAPHVGTGASSAVGSGSSSSGGTTSASTSTTTSASGQASGSTTGSQSSSSTGMPSQSASSGGTTSQTASTAASAVVATGVNRVTEESSSEDDEVSGMSAPSGISSSNDKVKKETPGVSNSDTVERESGRRYSLTDGTTRSRDLLNSNWDSNTALTPLELQRQQLYRELAVRTEEQISFFEEKLKNEVTMEGRVVGSVGVVTTGFSVGYLIWAVRGGMLLSGVLSQIPAWTMLDPLMVIDGDAKDDDKESLQTLMDRQQAKLNSGPKHPHPPSVNSDPAD